MAFSTMYIASTGMLALGTGMQTISNNLANVNTVGFKAGRTNYEDLISQCYYSGNNHNQVGRGSRVESIQSLFTQGSFMGEQGDTDLAIAGDGFFSVRKALTNEIMYTRAGVYTWNKEGYLEDPNHNILQGWAMTVPKAGDSARRIGSPVDIQITTLKAPPIATESIKLAVNLNADDQYSYYYDAETSEGSGLEGDGYAGAWNANQTPPIDRSDYSYAEAVAIYDEAGNAHDLMIYYQKNPHMENVWDYLITLDPKEDARSADSGALFDSHASFAGLIQKGKITFTADDDELGHGGLVKSIEAENLDLAAALTAYTEKAGGGSSSAMNTAAISGHYTGKPTLDASAGTYAASERTYTLTWGYGEYDEGSDTWTWSDNQPGSRPMSAVTWVDDLGNIGYIAVDDKAYPGPYAFGSGLTVSFGLDESGRMTFGAAGADSIEVVAHGELAAWTEASLTAEGVFSFDLSFVNTAAPDLSGAPYPADAPTITQTVALNMGATKIGDDWEQEEFGTTQYAANNSVTLKEQDGFPEGSLQRVVVTEDGRVIGLYGPKREQELYQIGLTRFLNPWGLAKEGENLFSANRYSGDGRLCVPGEEAGTILGGYLEQSNVDTATEIVQMIVTQRGFQANSKSITTSDTMLATAIQLKR
ncbi:MAG: flagellar hook-basal body complex protein [Candidatus Adiutrix sp.]|jgi:flagellar hook-basal body protein|nr:flagellar hook-basal body complex protein [Candidatus Adiutrix sp.]